MKKYRATLALASSNYGINIIMKKLTEDFSYRIEEGILFFLQKNSLYETLGYRELIEGVYGPDQILVSAKSISTEKMEQSIDYFLNPPEVIRAEKTRTDILIKVK